MPIDYAKHKTDHLSISDEKNERVKESIRKKMAEYLDRAEKLKEHLNTPKKKAVAAAASGGNAKYVPNLS